jgi:pentatricopeptide repeat protein
VCTSAGRWDDALHFYMQLKQYGLRPDAKLWMTMLAALSKGRQWHLIDKLWHGLEVSAALCAVRGRTQWLVRIERVERIRR